MTRDALLTDRYELAMLLGYLRAGMAGRRATCELFVRRLPASRPFLVTAGLERIVKKLLDLRFHDDEIEWLASQPALAAAFTPEARRYLRELRFRGDLWAMPEGTVAFPDEPLLRVEAALPEAQLVETLLLSIVNHDARVATKAARVALAAGARPCFEFGARRTHEEAAVDAARAAYVGGFAGTSNEEAGRRWGVPVSGTCAHMWVLSFAEEGEEASFRAYAEAFPGGTTLLVDTYDTLRGVERAVAAAGPALGGVRLDSGDLAALSVGARARLDAAGLGHAKVVASGDLNEYKIRALDARGAKIDVFGVGTDVVATPDAPALGAVYKLVEVESASGAPRPVAKRSEGKATWPGAKQVFRTRRGGRFAGDEVALASERREGAEPLLVKWIEGGKPARALPALAAVREHAMAEVAALPEELKAIAERYENSYPVRISPALRELAEHAWAEKVEVMS
jgi:nicotinate phosphoribosyltransferase